MPKKGRKTRFSVLNEDDSSSDKSNESPQKDKTLQEFYNSADSIGKAYCEFRQVEQQMKQLPDAKQVTWPPYKQRFLDYEATGGAKPLYEWFSTDAKLCYKHLLKTLDLVISHLRLLLIL